jgi:hypothetical protein
MDTRLDWSKPRSPKTTMWGRELNVAARLSRRVEAVVLSFSQMVGERPIQKVIMGEE